MDGEGSKFDRLFTGIEDVKGLVSDLDKKLAVHLNHCETTCGVVAKHEKQLSGEGPEVGLVREMDERKRESKLARWVVRGLSLPILGLVAKAVYEFLTRSPAPPAP